MIDASGALLEALRALSDGLDELGEPHMIIGGIAVIARGVPRLTTDIDATVWAPELEIDDVIRCFSDHGIVGRIPDLVSFARSSQVFLLRHSPTATPMEVSLGWLPFELEAMERAERMDVGGVSVRVATPEDLVVLKAVAWRDRDRADIARLLERHGREIDLERVRDLVRQFGEAMEEPERLAEFNLLASQILGSG